MLNIISENSNTPKRRKNKNGKTSVNSIIAWPRFPPLRDRHRGADRLNFKRASLRATGRSCPAYSGTLGQRSRIQGRTWVPILQRFGYLGPHSPCAGLVAAIIPTDECQS